MSANRVILASSESSESSEANEGEEEVERGERQSSPSQESREPVSISSGRASEDSPVELQTIR